MPLTNRNGYEEYKNKHIPNSIFFDLDKNSNKKTDLPHMLVELNEWEKIVSEMGINNNDQIVIYDNSDVISSFRFWYNFIYYFHKPDLVKVLNVGLKKWINENRITCTELPHIKKNYIAKEIRNLLKDKKEIDENISKNFKVIDARSIERFR